MSIPLARCLHHLSFFLWNRCSPYIPSFPNIPLPVPHSYAILNTDFIEEKYRSGHNGPDSKSCGELFVSSTKNLVAMRVLPGSKIEYVCCSFRQFFPKPFSIGKREGKTAAEHRGRVIEVVITSRTRNLAGICPFRPPKTL